MIQFGQRFGFAREALRKGGVVTNGRRKNFQRNDPFEVLLMRFVNETHSALAKQREDFQLCKVFRDFFRSGRGGSGVRWRPPRAASAAQPHFHQAFRAQVTYCLRAHGLSAILAAIGLVHKRSSPFTTKTASEGYRKKAKRFSLRGPGTGRVTPAQSPLDRTLCWLLPPLVARDTAGEADVL